MSTVNYTRKTSYNRIKQSNNCSAKLRDFVIKRKQIKVFCERVSENSRDSVVQKHDIISYTIIQWAYVAVDKAGTWWDKRAHVLHTVTWLMHENTHVYTCELCLMHTCKSSNIVDLQTHVSGHLRKFAFSDTNYNVILYGSMTARASVAIRVLSHHEYNIRCSQFSQRFILCHRAERLLRCKVHVAYKHIHMLAHTSPY